ncbi:Gfo/Idh/MocA family protein [Neorhizobium sp. NPDC001467]|uniref:Gfo/Idh/MocA family protein n=1 Tax=Neorhizobium sp. NPDC001467 TaxID=3390595 RepID=UPI003D008484
MKEIGKVLRIGIIGTGAIGSDHARRINHVLTGARITALTDVHQPSAETVRDTIAPDARIFNSGEELISSAEIDAVLVTSLGATHEAYVLQSIAAGKPCFCEKPLAHTSEGAKRVVDAETAYGKRLVQVGFMRRFDRGYIALKNAVRHIGSPVMIHAAHRNQSVPGTYTTPMAIHETLIHEIDVLRWLLEDDYVSARVVFPRSAARSHSQLKDPQIVLLETANGVVIDVEIFVNCHYGYDIQCEIVGEDGVARLPEPSAVEMRVNGTRQNSILTDWKDRFVDSYDVELQAFIRSASSGVPGGPSAWDGYVAAITADACVRAQESNGAEVRIDLPPRPSLYD